MDTLGLTATVVSLVIFCVALFEAVSMASIIGKIPRFWFFFLAAIGFLVVRRLLLLFSTAFSVALPSYWSTLDADATPLIFGALLLLWILDMKKSFQRAVPKARAQLLSPEQP